MTAPPRIYLDNAASTPPLPAVVDAMAEAQRQLFGNPSSAHSFGPPARNALEDAREFLRGTLGAARLVFTSGGSEADYLGIVGSAAPRPSGRVLMAASDHPALLQCAELLARYRHRVTVLPVTAHGDVAPETLFEALGQDVRTVALMFGHNELGTLCQLRELVDLVRRTAAGAHVHVDLVQTYGKLPFDLDEVHVDSVAVSGHKFHGPRGAGFLALSSTAEVAPLQLAGGQEHGMRGGTENVAGAIGLRVAAEHALSHQAAHEAHMRELASLTFATVREAIPEAERLGHPERALPHILSMRLPGVVAPTLLARCDARGVAFSSGSACHTGANDKGNPVLTAIGLDKQQAREVVRVSFSAMTPRADAQVAARIIADEARLLRDAAPRDGVPGNRASGAGR